MWLLWLYGSLVVYLGGERFLPASTSYLPHHLFHPSIPPIYSTISAIFREIGVLVECGYLESLVVYPGRGGYFLLNTANPVPIRRLKSSL